MNFGDGSVAQATPVAQPVGFGQQMTAMTPDHTFLLTHNGMYVRQHLEVLELLSGCETKNRYSIAPIAANTPIPAQPSVEWSREFRASAGFNPLLKGKEESECCERVCCPLFRGFTMPFVDGNQTAFFTIRRPFKCDPCYCAPLCLCNPQELSVEAGGSVVAHAKETTGMCCTTGCCARQFTATDTSGKVLYTASVNDCCSESGGCNCCAPTCFNEALTVDVKDAHGAAVDPSTFVWPGCNCGGLTDLSNMVVAFPKDATANERAALMGVIMLVEFTVMEMRRQNNKNNGGGGGGAPPGAVEMAR
eukprot:CAMPEP_0119353074 /NCGR_PEP_ID=MMETSP1334-20130426/2289_1 /TAXON_ID=127549 /ORGANISM="Calcidiscus leptoporus, Strain RCC1130" /LENGTH=304 /DNA_ID=CAMNT_0007366277 /DNA_START=57 /DNA_END=971 /DNA_ORIENTATION=+